MESIIQNPSIQIETKETHFQTSQKSDQLGCKLSSNGETQEKVAEGNGEKKCNNNNNNEDIDSGRERLKRHRIEVAGRVWIPEIWGQEELLKDWIDCSAFEASFVPNRIMSARSALVEEGRRTNTGRLRIENRC